jgi:hypothetical protein
MGNDITFLGVFRTEGLRKYDLSQGDALALYWFFRSALSGWMKRAPQRDATYYWVNYKYAAECLFTTPRAVQDSFDRLCGYYRGKRINPQIIYPLGKLIIPTASGRRCYFGLNKEPFLEIVIQETFSGEEYVLMDKSMNSTKLIEADLPPTNGKGGIRPEIQDIIEELLQIHQRGKESPLVFANRLPKPGGNYTKTILQAARTIQSIYAGRFARDCRVGSEFLDRNGVYITDDTWRELDAMKGSWEAVRDGLFGAVKNYRQWFWPENEPEHKDWLPRDISTWLFDRFNQSSVFLACILGKPYPLRETKADRVYESLPPKIRSIGETLYQEGWDPVVFWLKMKDIVGWYEDNCQLISSEPNLRYWFEGSLVIWFRKYVNWVSTLDGLYLKQVGIGNPTWTAWCTHSAKEHGFSLKKLNL